MKEEIKVLLGIGAIFFVGMLFGGYIGVTNKHILIEYIECVESGADKQYCFETV